MLSPLVENKAKTQADKLPLIVAGAVRAFAQHGFSRTQMAEVAQESGVALGTLYRYAPSKEALFHMALLFGAGATEREIASAQSDERLFEIVSRFVVGLDLPRQIAETEKAASNAAQPVTAFFGGLYDRIDRIHPALRILDRSAREWPDLEVLFATHVRAPAILAIEHFLREAGARGEIGRVSDAPSTARLILEMITWFAMHRRYTPSSADITDGRARETVLEFTEAALRPSGVRPGSTSKQRGQQ